MKNLSSIGKPLTKNHQKLIIGGNPPPGFPDECLPEGNYLLPACNHEQQELADNGDTYWKCICGKSKGIFNKI
jgi:hypothetical protein